MTVYRINGAAGGFAFGPPAKTVGTLVITRTITQSLAQDAPAKVTYGCALN